MKDGTFSPELSPGLPGANAFNILDHMDYDEYIHLHREHERLKWIYHAAVDLLFEIGFMATDYEYLTLKASVDDARYNLEIARQKLERCERGEKRAAVSAAVMAAAVTAGKE